jgi:hypothetical protein
MVRNGVGSISITRSNRTGDTISCRIRLVLASQKGGWMRDSPDAWRELQTLFELIDRKRLTGYGIGGMADS